MAGGENGVLLPEFVKIGICVADVKNHEIL